MDNFEKYKKAKLALYKMVAQFYSEGLPLDIADGLEILYEKKDVKNNNVEVLFHNYDSDGLLAWQYLELRNSIILIDDFYNKQYNLRYENRKNIDYENIYLKISLLVANLTLKHYSKIISLEDANTFRIKYNSDFDLEDNSVEVCDHLFEGAGESAWELFEIKDHIIGKSIIEGIKNNYRNKLLINESPKVKKMKRN